MRISKVLNLSRNELGDLGVSAIAAIFGSVEVVDFRIRQSILPISALSLSVLDLSYNDLGDSAALALCKAGDAVHQILTKY
jgi:hypothetical protein